MKINNREYTEVKKYPTYILMKSKAGYYECFNKQDLGMIKEKIKPPKTYINAEKTKI